MTSTTIVGRSRLDFGHTGHTLAAIGAARSGQHHRIDAPVQSLAHQPWELTRRTLEPDRARPEYRHKEGLSVTKLLPAILKPRLDEFEEFLS